MTTFNEIREAPVTGTEDPILKELAALHKKVDELLEDSRAARPLLHKYLKFAQNAPWSRIGGKKHG